MIKIFEMFSGYGGASHALKIAGIPYENIGFSEIDKDAIKCFEKNFKGVKNYGDCKFIDPAALPDFNLLTAGFPCQPFSEAGKHRGIADTRGTLFYDIIRIAEVKQPDFMVLENVKGLTFLPHKKTMSIILDEIDRIGYDIKYKVLNSRNYGTPQNRERVVFLCSLKNLGLDLTFPEEIELKLFLKDIVDNELKDTSLDFESTWSPGFERDCFPDEEVDQLAHARIISVAVRNKNRAKHQSLGLPYGSFPVEHHLRFNRDWGVSFAVKSAKHEFMISNLKLENVRYLTGKECFRLMGFFRDEIDLSGLSNSAISKLAGNGWDVNMFSQILAHLFKSYDLRSV